MTSGVFPINDYCLRNGRFPLLRLIRAEAKYPSSFWVDDAFGYVMSKPSPTYATSTAFVTQLIIVHSFFE